MTEAARLELTTCSTTMRASGGRLRARATAVAVGEEGVVGEHHIEGERVAGARPHSAHQQPRGGLVASAREAVGDPFGHLGAVVEVVGIAARVGPQGGAHRWRRSAGDRRSRPDRRTRTRLAWPAHRSPPPSSPHQYPGEAAQSRPDRGRRARRRAAAVDQVRVRRGRGYGAAATWLPGRLCMRLTTYA